MALWERFAVAVRSWRSSAVLQEAAPGCLRFPPGIWGRVGPKHGALRDQRGEDRRNHRNP